MIVRRMKINKAIRKLQKERILFTKDRFMVLYLTLNDLHHRF